MKKINNKSINYGLKIMAILAFSLLIIPAKASASYDPNGLYGNWDNGSNTPYSYNPYYYQPPYQPPIYTPPPAPAPIPIVYSNSVNPNPNVVNPAIAPKTAKAKTTSTSNTVASSAPAANSNTYSGLAANIFYGINSFLPSGLIQWIFFAILVLLLIILTRIIFGAKENYHATPLKHE